MTDISTRPLKVFLCHAHGDKDAVRELYSRLKRDGVDAWLDKANLLPGMDWAVEIRKAVAQSDVVIVCLSKQFNQEGFRQKEVRIALDEADKKSPETIFIIPVRLEECEVPDSLNRWHWVNLYEKDGYRILLRALTVRAEQISAIPPHRKSGTTRPIAVETKAITPPQEEINVTTPKPEVKKPDEIKTPPVIEKPEEKQEVVSPEAMPANKADVGRDVSGSVIVTGNGNVINLGKQEPFSPVPSIRKPEPKKEGARRKPKVKIIAALVSLLVFGIISFAIFSLIAPDASSSTQSQMISYIYTSTNCGYYNWVLTFSRDENIYLCVDFKYEQSNVQLVSRWYYQANIFGKELHFPLATQSYLTDNNDGFVYFNLANPGINGSYRVDVYKDQELVGIRYFRIEK